MNAYGFAAAGLLPLGIFLEGGESSPMNSIKDVVNVFILIIVVLVVFYSKGKKARTRDFSGSRPDARTPRSVRKADAPPPEPPVSSRGREPVNSLMRSEAAIRADEAQLRREELRALLDGGLITREEYGERMRKFGGRQG